jgi:hypothetical protein
MLVEFTVVVANVVFLGFVIRKLTTAPVTVPAPSIEHCPVCGARYLGVRALSWHVQAAHPFDEDIYS